MTDAHSIISQIEANNMKRELLRVKLELITMRAQLEALAKRSGEIERSAMLVAAQATELCRQLRGGHMEHLRTEP